MPVRFRNNAGPWSLDEVGLRRGRQACGSDKNDWRKALSHAKLQRSRRDRLRYLTPACELFAIVASWREASPITPSNSSSCSFSRQRWSSNTTDTKYGTKCTKEFATLELSERDSTTTASGRNAVPGIDAFARERYSTRRPACPPGYRREGMARAMSPDFKASRATVLTTGVVLRSGVRWSSSKPCLGQP